MKQVNSNDKPENLAKSIIIEAAELLENYQWGPDHADLENVKEEIADVVIYAMAMAYDLGFDIEEMIYEKLEKNALKYPPKK
jgi:NTP pyrophosphatase (non-canonical NTP hydrolase)